MKKQRMKQIKENSAQALDGVANQQETVYQKGEAYWKNVEPSDEGMLGRGNSTLSGVDARDSVKFIQMLSTKKPFAHARALDCGSGIGRVSKHVLLPLFDMVDMVDVVQNFLTASSEYLGPELNSRIGQKVASGLQHFSPRPRFYDLIWIQGVVGHLNDEDLVAFLQRCKTGLKPDSIIVLKENIASTQETDFDEVDSSCTRPKHLLLKIFKNAGLKVISQRKQTKWPLPLYRVRMFALE